MIYHNFVIILQAFDSWNAQNSSDHGQVSSSSWIPPFIRILDKDLCNILNSKKVENMLDFPDYWLGDCARNRHRSIFGYRVNWTNPSRCIFHHFFPCFLNFWIHWQWKGEFLSFLPLTQPKTAQGIRHFGEIIQISNDSLKESVLEFVYLQFRSKQLSVAVLFKYIPFLAFLVSLWLFLSKWARSLHYLQFLAMGEKKIRFWTIKYWPNKNMVV